MLIVRRTLFRRTQGSTFRISRLGVAVVAGGLFALAAPACGGSSLDGSGTSPAVDAGQPEQDASTTPVVVDAGADVDNGAPSDTFPAPHPAAPQVESYGGRVLTTPHIQPILFPGDPLANDVKAFTHALAGSSYWHAAVSEYGVGDVTVADPIVVPPEDTTLTTPVTYSDAQIQTWLQQHLDGAHAGWGSPDASTIYTIFYPEGVTVTLDPFGESCKGFGGYHEATTVGSGKVPYAVIPRCTELAAAQTPLQATTAAASHEFIEAATDPGIDDLPAYATADQDHLYYDLLPLSEVGDMCVYESDAFFAPAEIGYTVQRTWSNVAAKAGGSPCAPGSTDSPYFAAVPVFSKRTDMDFGAQGGRVPVKGLKVALNESATFDLDLISSAKTDPFFVKIVDARTYQQEAPELEFTLDREAGQNGEILHATVTRVATASQYGGSEFIVVAYTDPTHYHMWMGWAED